MGDRDASTAHVVSQHVRTVDHFCVSLGHRTSHIAFKNIFAPIALQKSMLFQSSSAAEPHWIWNQIENIDPALVFSWHKKRRHVQHISFSLAEMWYLQS